MKPFVYLSYGIPKSGSTLAFELAKEVFEQNGHPQVPLSSTLVPGGRSANFIGDFSNETADLLWSEVERIGYPVVVKTHGELTPAARRLLERGRAIGHCTYRDPREIILSLLDAGEKARRTGHTAFSKVTSIDIAVERVAKHIERIGEWMRAPHVIPLFYPDIAFESRKVVQIVADQVGLPVDPERAEHTVKTTRFTQLNKGRKDRHLTDLTPVQNDALYARFKDFIDVHCRSLLAAKPVGMPAPMGRLERCPCGSGKRYKDCHGRLP